MRLAFLSILIAALHAAPAAAAPLASGDPAALGRAIEHDPGTVVAAAYSLRAGSATTAIGGAASSTSYPLHGGTMAYLSDGDATAGFSGAQADNANHDLATEVRGGHDVTILALRVAVPEEANCLTLGASFFSEDYGDANSDDPRYFDSFLAELDPQVAWAAGSTDPSSVVAPANFALVAMPDGLKPVSALVHSGTFSTQNAFGTAFDGTSQWHTFKAPVTPGEHVLELSIFDRADGSYDSTALIDDLRLIRRRAGTCGHPGRDQFSTGEDLDAPQVAITATGARIAGTADGEEGAVTLRVGTRTWSAPVEMDGTWWVNTGLAPGTHTARASQFDAAGNERLSPPRTFTIGTPPAPTPTTTPSPPPTASPSPEPTATSSPIPSPSSEPTTTPSSEPTSEPTPDPTTEPEDHGPGPEEGTDPQPGHTTTSPSPTTSAPAPGGFAAATPCPVPKLRGKKLVSVGRALRHAGCRIGKVSRTRARKGRRGRVVAQAPRAGARRPGGARVKVTLRR